jgi:predicted nucleic acid-binding protein
MGFAVHGTLGILIRSIRRKMGSRKQVLEILQSLPDPSTLHISRRLLATVIAKVEQAPE